MRYWEEKHMPKIRFKSPREKRRTKMKNITCRRVCHFQTIRFIFKELGTGIEWSQSQSSGFRNRENINLYKKSYYIFLIFSEIDTSLQEYFSV